MDAFLITFTVCLLLGLGLFVFVDSTLDDDSQINQKEQES